MSDSEKQVEGWLAPAERELLAAELVLGMEPALSEIATFHAAQAAARALRGYLASQGDEPPGSHSLSQLIDECYALDPEFASLSDAAAVLAPYQKDYLGLSGRTPSVSDAERVLDLAAGILRFVQDRL